MSTPSFYAILTANVRYDKEINFRQKVLFAEITALANKNGYCHASNSFFAELYDTTPETISRDISALRKRGYLNIYIDQEAGNKRRLYPQTAAPIDETNKGIDEIINRGHDHTRKTPIDRTRKHNNTRDNTTSVNKETHTQTNQENTKYMSAVEAFEYAKHLLRGSFSIQFEALCREFKGKLTPHEVAENMRDVLYEREEKGMWAQLMKPENEHKEYTWLTSLLARTRKFCKTTSKNRSIQQDAPKRLSVKYRAQ